jgi:FlaA1/EpsC-like NDP-sugar epimerase
MLPSQAAGLVLRATEIAKPGEIIVLRMRGLRICDLADACREFFCNVYRRSSRDIEIKVVGANPGEKLHEELMTTAEASRAYEKEDFYVIRFPLAEHRIIEHSKLKALTSDSVPLLSIDEIVSLLFRLYKREAFIKTARPLEDQTQY